MRQAIESGELNRAQAASIVGRFKQLFPPNT
jgi:hypothetical protein